MMGDELYWIHRLKRNENVTEEEFEAGWRELHLLWVGPGRCKKTILIKAVDVPWQPGRSQEFDYLSVSVWDKAEHRQCVEDGGVGRDRPELRPFWDKFDELDLGQIVKGLGSVEVVDSVQR